MLEAKTLIIKKSNNKSGKVVNFVPEIVDGNEVYVNAAYTSQGDSRFNCALMGTRIGDSFIGFDEVVLDADINAAINILARLYDSEINLYTSAEKVKEILTKRADAVLSASVETAQLGLQQVVPIILGLHPKSGLSKKSSKKLAKVS